MVIFLLRKIEDIYFVLFSVEKNNFLRVHHHEGVHGMLKFVLIKDLPESIAVIECVSAYAHNSQKGKSVIDCNRKVEDFVECFV